MMCYAHGCSETCESEIWQRLGLCKTRGKCLHMTAIWWIVRDTHIYSFCNSYSLQVWTCRNHYVFGRRSVWKSSRSLKPLYCLIVVSDVLRWVVRFKLQTCENTIWPTILMWRFQSSPAAVEALSAVESVVILTNPILTTKQSNNSNSNTHGIAHDSQLRSPQYWQEHQSFQLNFCENVAKLTLKCSNKH